MRWLCTGIICVGCVLLAGCNEEQAGQQTKKLDVELVKTLNNIQVENAILTQRTLYPYHFTADAAQLNELGQRDLAVLARHFAEHPGSLNVHRGEAADSLYQARVAHVLDQLKAAGVKTERISVAEGLPGGPGMLSEQVVTILEKEPQSRVTGRSTTMGTTSR